MPGIFDSFNVVSISTAAGVDTSGFLKPFNDLVGMIMNLESSIQGVSAFVGAATYILGVILIAKGIFKLRVMADHRSQMFQPMEFGGPMVSIIVGGMLIWSNTLLDSMTQTLWGSTSPLDYQPSFSGDFNAVWNVILDLMKVIGFIAFIRGWYYLTKMGQQGAQGMIGKGLTHIVGGTLAYHMGPTLHVLMTTFGFDISS